MCPFTIQFRFKSAGLPIPLNNIASSDIRYSQSLWSTNDGGNIVLEYEGSGFVTGSYSGSIIDPYDYYGTLKWIPANDDDPSLSASVYLPFFNEDWWSVQVSFDGVYSSSLYVANELDGRIGFSGSEDANGFDVSYLEGATKAFLNFDSDIVLNNVVYKPFSGSFQELRYWGSPLNEDVFFDYVVNPYSNEGNTLNSTPDNLQFRAPLGTQLDTGSRTSIHPRVTGSAVQITQSFNDGTSAFYISNPNFVTNVEKIYQDQVIAGIKNRVTDKVEVEDAIIAESPYGFTNSSASYATISGQNSLSPLQSIQTTSYLSQSYTPDINYLEVAFSPQNQINDDINAQIGYFNIGEYIGDPRQISSSVRNYPDLDELRDAYFEKYIKSYDVVDFVRLIKFFDNSLFKMIKDFTPARTSLSSGVVVKQHILERNRQRQAIASSSFHDYSGSIQPQSRNYSTGSKDVGAYEFISGSSIYKFSGGTGGSFEKFNGLQTSPSASDYNLTNRFGITQSFSESIEYSIADRITNSGSFVGYRDITVSDQKEFYDGEFSGSNLEVTDMIANPGCTPYLKIGDKPIFFNPLFFSLTSGVFTQGTTTSDEIILNTNHPAPGDAWIISKKTQDSPIISKVQYIRLSRFDANNIDVGNYLDDSTSLKINIPDASVRDNSGVVEYFINGVTTFSDSTLLRISQDKGDNIEITEGSTTYYPITSSENGGSENWSLSASGDFRTSDEITFRDELQQGNFINPNTLNQEQYFWFYNGEINDELNFFNTGSSSENLYNILSDPTKFNFGTYNPQRTSNIPWYFSCSIEYSASDLNVTEIEQRGIYHSSSNYTGTGLISQDFTLSASLNPSGLFKPSPKIVDIPYSSIINPSYNSLIPGDSGSEAGLLGGHPKIVLPGTASMDFYFPSLTLNGTPRTLLPPVGTYSPFSGSTLIGTNDDFELDSLKSNFGIYWVNFSGSTAGSLTSDKDGTMWMDSNDIKSLIRTLSGRGDALVFTVDLEIDFLISGSVPFEARLEYRDYGSSDAWTESIDGSYTSSPNPQGGHIIQSMGVVSSDVYYYSQIPDWEWRWAVRAQDDTETEMKYFFGEHDCSKATFYYDYNFSGPGEPKEEFLVITDLWASANFQGSSTEKQDHDFIFSPSGDAYPQIDITAELRRTGSGIPPEGYLITSSDTLSNQEIYGGKTFTFPDSPILNILNDTNPANTDSTRNNEDDMYYIAYSMSNYNVISTTSPDETFNVEFLDKGDPETKIIITQSVVNIISGYDLTGSFKITQGNPSNPSQVGSTIISQEFIVPNETSTGRVTLSGSFTFPFAFDDSFRMGVEVNKNFTSGLAIREYTMSIFPSESLYASLPNPTPAYNNYKESLSTGFIIPTYFGSGILPFNKSLDCQPTLNNYNDIRPNSYIMDVDYTNTTGSITPVNQEQLVNKTAVKATIPDSNYTSLRSINPRYDGVKSICKEINVWNIGDTGTFGKNPNINLKDAFFGYFNDLDDPYPNINGLTRVNLNYLIDEQGNALPPSLEGLGEDTLKAVFPINTQTKIAAQQGNRKYQILGDPTNIAQTFTYYSPIMYSQNSGNNYTNIIPLSGSGYISRYDNDDENSVVFAQFVAQGTASVDTSTPVTSVDYYLDPSEEIIKGSGVDPSYNPWNSDGYTNYPTIEWGGTNGDDLSNAQVVSLKHSVFTTLISETNRVGKEMQFELHMYTGSQDPTTEVPFNLRDITCKVYTEDGKVTEIGDLLDYGWFHIDNVVNWREKRVKHPFRFFRRRKGYWKTTKVPVPTGGLKFSIDGYEMWDTLYNRGLIRVNKPKDYSGVIAMEWIIDANSGAYNIKVGDEINWRIKGGFKNARRGYRQGYFFPDDYTGVKTPTKIQGQGVYDHLQSEANTAQAPFWVYSGSVGGSFAIKSKNVLVMSSSNMNEAYGPSFSQGDIKYQPGPSEYFPGGIEPQTTAFDEIEYPLELAEGDEIRFGNNENFTYRINRVVPPSENIEGGKGRLKIFLDKDVDESVNKDFFLIRRPIPNPNSMYLDIPFPYGTLASASISTGILNTGSNQFALSGSIDSDGNYTASFSDIEIQSTPGILYPDFPTEYLIQSASSIVNDLISKGIIQS